MYWTEMTVDVPGALCETAADMLFAYGASAVVELEARDGRTRLRAHLLWSPDADAEAARLRAALHTLARERGERVRVRIRCVLHEIPTGGGGAHGWCFDAPMRVWQPDRIGVRVVVKDPEAAFAADPSDVVINLVPSRAFGNGAHETTRLCVRALERHLRAEDVVFDVGTGTGLLALAAAALGAGGVVGFDIEEEAVRAAQENARLNHVEDRMTALGADRFPVLVDEMPGRVDVVVANLLPWVIEEIAPDVRRALAPAGRFIVSGLRVSSAGDLDRVLITHGFDVLDVAVEGDWCALVYRPSGQTSPPSPVDTDAPDHESPSTLAPQGECKGSDGE